MEGFDFTSALELEDVEILALVVEHPALTIGSAGAYFDGVILLKNKVQMLSLICSNPQQFWRLGRGPNRSQDFEYMWNEFDAVRVTGPRPNQWATLLTIELFHRDSGRLDILCADDTRLRNEVQQDGTEIWTIHQATRCPNSLSIHHEGYILSTDPLPCLTDESHRRLYTVELQTRC